MPPGPREAGDPPLWPLPLPEAEDELRVVRHPVRRPRRIPRQLHLDVLDAGNGGRRVVDPLLDHRPGGAAHRREAVDHLDLRALDLDVVEQAELDDVHPELGILDVAQRLRDVVFRNHGPSLAAGIRVRTAARSALDSRRRSRALPGGRLTTERRTFEPRLRAAAPETCRAEPPLARRELTREPGVPS